MSLPPDPARAAAPVSFMPYPHPQPVPAPADVGVVTVTYGNRLGFLAQVVDAASREGVQWVLVVDNGTAEDCRAALAQLQQRYGKRLELLRLPENTGSAGGFKAGLAQVQAQRRCDYIWLLDDDNVPEPGALRVLLEQHARLRHATPPDRLAVSSYRNTTSTRRRLKKGLPAGLVFPLPSSFHKFHLLNGVRNLARAALLRWRTLTHNTAVPEAVRVPYAPWGGLLIHRSVLDTCGLPDERFFVYADDNEFTHRLVRAGGAVYLVFASVVRDVEEQWHRGVRQRALMGDSDLRAYYNARNRAYFDAHCAGGHGLVYAINRRAYLIKLALLAALRGRRARHRLLRRAIADGEAGRLGRVADAAPATGQAPHRLGVGFLFNHYADHQLLHGAPIAFDLSRLQSRIDVTLIAGSATTARHLEQLAARYPDHRCSIVTAALPARARLWDALVGRYSFVRKRAVLEHNRSLFATLDALVVPEMNSLRLKTRPGLERLRMVHVSHGPKHRWTGRDERLRLFDLVLVPGRKACERLTTGGFVAPERCRIVGYPKFDLGAALDREAAQLFDNDRPVVLYNPHFKRRESSWYRMGLAVLEYFRNHPEYNLIFAPHVVLFARRWRHHARVPRRYCDRPNILIDTGSQASIDMTYTRAADVYLGDVSSQVYEFWCKPRPSIFLDAHAVPWQTAPDYRHWQGGEVLDDVAQLGPALARATDLHRSRYRAVQERLFADTFELTSTPSAQRAAQAIAEHLLAADVRSEPHEVAPVPPQVMHATAR